MARETSAQRQARWAAETEAESQRVAAWRKADLPRLMLEIAARANTTGIFTTVVEGHDGPVVRFSHGTHYIDRQELTYLSDEDDVQRVTRYIDEIREDQEREKAEKEMAVRVWNGLSDAEKAALKNHVERF